MTATATPTRAIRTWAVYDGPLDDDGPKPELEFITTDADDALDMALKGHGVRRLAGHELGACTCARCCEATRLEGVARYG